MRAAFPLHTGYDPWPSQPTQHALRRCLDAQQARSAPGPPTRARFTDLLLSAGGVSLCRTCSLWHGVQGRAALSPPAAPGRPPCLGALIGILDNYSEPERRSRAL